MEFWLIERSSLVLVISGLITFSAVAAIGFLISNQVLKDPKSKGDKDKALLKELLEGFGLEIPAELNDSDSSVLKTIKKS